jgi:hypothetical protein
VPTYDIEVTRDGRWWIITVPGLDGFVTPSGAINVGDTTQARYEGEIDDMAREFIAVTLDIPIEDVHINRLS